MLADFVFACVVEGNYWDEPVHDCSQLSFATVQILVNKIAIVFEKYTKQGEAVLLFLPQVIQLPLSILAAAKAGVTAIPLDPAKCNEEKLRKIIEEGRPVLTITVDAYWLGQQLQETYKLLSGVLDAQTTSIARVLVIRHTSPNPGVPPPEEHVPARRPYYLIEWKIKEGRDVEWSDEIRKVPLGVDYAGRQHSTLVLLSDRDELRPFAEEEILKKIEAFPHLPTGPVFSLVHPESTLGLVSLLAAWSQGLPLVQYEGPLNYPDSARIAHIARKYEANSIIIEEMQIDVEYIQFVNTDCLENIVGPANMKKIIDEGFPTAKYITIKL